MKNIRFNSVSSLLMAGIATLSLGGVAGAQSAASEAPKIVLHYSAADLSSERGVRALYSRLELAAERVCPQPASTLWASDAIVACRKQALAKAVAQVHNERLAALSASRSNKG